MGRQLDLGCQIVGQPPANWTAPSTTPSSRTSTPPTRSTGRWSASKLLRKLSSCRDGAMWADVSAR